MRLAIIIDVDEDARLLDLQYALTNAARLANRDIEILGIPQPGQGRHLPMQNYQHVHYALLFHSPE